MDDINVSTKTFLPLSDILCQSVFRRETLGNNPTRKQVENYNKKFHFF